jgi:nucleoside-diphosphate-sugar epimerase
VEILIPGLDHDLSVLAEHEELFAEHGVKVLVGGREITHLCRDKRRWGKTLNQISPAILSGYTPAEAKEALLSGTLRLPLIAKPMGGSGSADVKLLTSTNDFADLGENELVQAYVMPHKADPAAAALEKALANRQLLQMAEISCQWLVSRKGEILAHMASHNRLKNGIPIEIIPVDDTPYLDALAPLIPYLRDIGMRGPVNIQGRMTAEGPRFFEMNCRFTGITGLRAVLGFNEVDLALRSFMDLPLPTTPLKINQRRVGLRQVAERAVSVTEHTTLQDSATQQVPQWRRPESNHILVTGATGWLGRHLVNALLDRNNQDHVHVAVRSPERAALFWPNGADRLHIWSIDELQRGNARIAQLDVIFHLAAERDTQNGAGNAKSLALTQELVLAAAQVDLPRFIFISSQSIYGLMHPPPWSETAPANPSTTYSMSKWAGEQLTSALGEISRTSRGVSVRLARIYGAAKGLRWNELPHKFVREALAGKTLQVSGGEQLFDLLHIRDAVRALLSLLEIPHSSLAPVYNIGSCAPVGIIELANTAITAAHLAGGPETALRINPATDPPVRIGMDCRLFCRDSGWSPEVSLEHGLQEIAELSSFC